MSEHDDRRSFVRLLLELPVTIRQERNQKETIGTCVDLSATGMSLKVDTNAYENQEKVTIKMMPEDENLPVFEATAVVIRVFEWEDAYKLALEFESIH